jgi:N,N-dimethylformamidase
MSSMLMGYLDELSVEAGETVIGRLSGLGKASARVVRLAKVSEFETESRPVEGFDPVAVELELQQLDAGSGFTFTLDRRLMRGSFVLRIPVCVTFIEERAHVLLALMHGSRIAEVMVDRSGLAWRVGNAPRNASRLSIGVGDWHVLTIKAAADALSLSLGEDDIVADVLASEAEEPWSIMVGRGFQSFGDGCYARFEGPTVYDPADMSAPVLSFDFASDFASPSIVSSGVVGRFLNHPTRRVLGRRRPDILGGSSDAEPSCYGAIHVHALDLTDARWEETVAIRLPERCASGIYALDIGTDRGERLRLPFVIRASSTHARTLFILPTNTYIAYGNERLAFSERGAAIAADTDGIQLNALDEALGAEPLLGASIYDRHVDRSGVHYSSRRRPILNLTPDYHGWWCTQVPRHFLADLNIPRWLDHIGESYDLVTDEDVHRQGSTLLKRYDVVITGTHPEYPSLENLRAMHKFGATGHLIYMGGNGFYWVTGHDPSDLGVIEARRGFAGQRNWTSDVLEVRLSTNGETGGLWRHRGLAPNMLTGVGSVAVGFTKGSGYERTPESRSERFAAFFEGVGDTIGDEGEILGAAASDELDASNVALGTPKDAVVLARSKHNRTYLPFIEEEMEIQHNLGGDHNRTVRSEIVFFERPTGGKVFAAGAVNFCGALGTNSFENSAARLATNVLRSFLSAPAT